MWIIPLVLAVLLLEGVWVGVALGLTGVIIIYLFGGGVPSLLAIPVATWNTLFNFPLVAIPLYIFLGEVLVFSGLASRAYHALSPFFERFPGKLLLTNVVVCALMGAVVGSSMVTAATVSAIAYPELSARGYKRGPLVGNLAGAGTLGSFVPPSLGLIIYGAWVQVSVGDLFIAAIFPALITVALFLLFLVVMCSVRTDIVPPGGEIMPLGRSILRTKDIWPMVILIFCVMGIIYLGIATPTEAGGLAGVIAIIMAMAYRTFNFRALLNALVTTARVCGMIFFIIVGAVIFSISVSVIGLPRQVLVFIGESGLSPLSILLLIYLLYLILGCFFDFISMLVMTLPFVFPIVSNLGYSPFWFGIVLVLVGEMGLLTPPVGMNLYVLQGITGGKVSLGEIAKGSMPYFFALGVTLFLITLSPELCTWLPTIID